ncbi:hypothetical protein [Aquimarina agarivorans]|uniref:hypothetical protein n=1 Tax=Aquimarina agarivorans TaxID=980584 RepID=UPI000248E6FC|nr:hypothetical protein [Aquimarina agarivorans]
MKRFLHTKRFKILFFATFLSGMSLSFAQAIPRLTKVDPENNLVTVTNFGDQPVNLIDYWFCLGPGTYQRLGALTPVSGSINLTANQNCNIALPNAGSW